MLIKQIHDLIDIAVDKGHTEPQRRLDITNAIHRASIMLFLEMEEKFGKDLLITQYLQPFIAVENTWDVSTELPANYFRYTYLATTDDDDIDVLADMEWSQRKADSIAGPNVDYPVAKIENNKVVVLPDSISTVKLKYLRFPARPVFSTTVSNGLEVFDAENSVDLEWSEGVLADIEGKVLSSLGIGLRSAEIVQYAEMQDNKSKA